MLKHNITYHRALTDEELREILTLQQENLPQELSATEKAHEGFVTIHHSFELLKRMNDHCPHIIARHHNKIVGYTLCMVGDFRADIPVLIPMFTEIDAVLSLSKESGMNYVIMGQVCIAKAYRKQGIFRGLYECMKTELKYEFDAVITEVDVENVRSSEAHKAIGFETLKTYISNGKHWEIIIWKWN